LTSCSTTLLIRGRISPRLPEYNLQVERRLAWALTAGALLWIVVIFLAPFALQSGPVLSTAAAFLYQGASLICHQRPERSFHLAGVQLPVCARCTGLYVSGAAAALSAWSGWRRPVAAPRRIRAVFALAAVPTAVTLVVELAGLAHPSNGLRALSALPLGAAAGWIFVRSLRAEASAGIAL
jgi:uncharacterized membrane protein